MIAQHILDTIRALHPGSRMRLSSCLVFGQINLRKYAAQIFSENVLSISPSPG